MSNIEIIPATLIHVQSLGETMNAEDIQEQEALGLKAHRILWRSWKNSVIRKTALVDGEVAAMWGVSGSLMGVLGRPWLLTGAKSREVSPHEFARIYRSEVRKMLELFPVLENWVDNSYVGAIKMLRLSGFSLDEPITLGKFKRMFRRFHKQREA